MKKALALLLALAMAFTLFACAKTDTPTADNSSASPPSSNVSASPAPATGGQAPASGIDEDFLNDPAHFDREPYKIAYVCNSLTMALNVAIDDSLRKLGKKLNYEYSSWAANNDFDAYINQIAVYADQGYDAIIPGLSSEIADRVLETCKELGIETCAESTAFMDENGLCIWPSVQMATYQNAVINVNWMADHYTDYWTDAIDTSKLGMLCLDYSVITSITERTPGVKDTFIERFPDAANNFFVGDLVTLGPAGFSVQGGNDMATQIFSSHPEIEYWFVVANVDDWGTGATRAAEALKMEDRVLVTCIQPDAFLKEMESGYTGNVFVGANAVSTTDMSIQLATCVVSILEGRATPETLWPEWRDPGGQYPRYQIIGKMITRDTYKDFIAEEKAKLE